MFTHLGGKEKKQALKVCRLLLSRKEKRTDCRRSFRGPCPLLPRPAQPQSMLSLVAPLHGIVMHLCAHARLGSSHARLGTHEDAFQGVGADWGGAEGIGTEVRKIKSELSQLTNPSDPAQVSNYLRQRCNQLFLEWDLTVRFYVRETFLGKGNSAAYDIVTGNITFGRPPLVETYAEPSVFLTSANVLPHELSEYPERRVRADAARPGVGAHVLDVSCIPGCFHPHPPSSPAP